MRRVSVGRSGVARQASFELVDEESIAKVVGQVKREAACVGAQWRAWETELKPPRA